jgi:hypothetical protein
MRRAALHADRAPFADKTLLLDVLRESRDDERAHRREVFIDATSACGVCLAQHVLYERVPRTLAVEVRASTNKQRLLEPTLHRAVARLDVSVLLLRAHSSRARRHAEVPHEREIVLVERPLPVRRDDALPVGDAMRRRGRVVRLQPLRHSPELEERRLNTTAKSRHRLTQTRRRPLPIRERQREHAEHVREGDARDGDAELRRPGEVHLRGLAGAMHLCEHDVALWPALRTPSPYVTLQRPKLPRLVAIRMPLDQQLEQRLRLELGRLLEHRDDLRPVRLERVRPRTPRPWRSHL